MAYQDGAPGWGIYPATPAAVLASTAAASGIATPTILSFVSPPLSPANTPVPLLNNNARRSFLLIYNPTVVVAQFFLGTTISQGNIRNLSVGPGEAFFWASAQGLQPTYTGPITAISEYGMLPLWAWEDGSNLYNNGGALAITIPPADYPTSPVGLPAGSVWNDGLEIAVVPGISPNPKAPPLFFGSITAEQLLQTGGGNLPLSNPGAGTLQLWNDGGVVAIA